MRAVREIYSLYGEATKKARQLADGPLVLDVPVGLERVSSIYANNVYGLVIYWSGTVKSEILDRDPQGGCRLWERQRPGRRTQHVKIALNDVSLAMSWNMV